MFFLQAPIDPPVIQQIFNKLDHSMLLDSIRLIDHHHKTLVETLDTNDRIVEACKEYLLKKASYETQNLIYLKPESGLYGKIVSICTSRFLSWAITPLRKRFPSFDSLFNNDALHLKIKKEVSRVGFDLSIMKLFGGKKGFEKLPPFTHETFTDKEATFKIEAAKMTAPIMRYQSDTLLLNLDLFIIRVKNPVTKIDVIQPYFRRPNNTWVTLECRTGERALVGRRDPPEDRLFIDAKVIDDALSGNIRLCEVLTIDGKKTSAYDELHDLVINKKSGSSDEHALAVV